MNSDIIKQEILKKLAQDPKVDASKIGVIVDNGIVTLTGRVHSMETCARAEALASEVFGVKAIAQEIKHFYPQTAQPEDEVIATKILLEFNRETMIPEDQLQIHVQGGCVTVNGDVYWLYQKNAVSAAIQAVHGVLDMVNQIRIVEPQSDQELEAQIAASLAKRDTIDPDGINIKCSSGAVTLTGIVGSNVERATLLHAIKSVAGVRFVSDKLVGTAKPYNA